MRLQDPVSQLKQSLQDHPTDLFHNALKIASVAHPKLNTGRYTSMMAEWAEELRARTAHLDDTRIKVEYLNEYFFNVLGFKGNHDNFDDAANSLLNEVMDSRYGIPVTLSVLYIALGAQIGLPLSGVSFPGHYLVRITLAEGIVILDPYNGGLCLDEQALAQLLVKHRKNADASELVKALDSASTEETLMRILRNLKAIYTDEQEQLALLNVLNMMLVITPDSIEERLERGLLLHEMECNHVALDDLRHYLCTTPLMPNQEVLNLVNRLNAASTAIH